MTTSRRLYFLLGLAVLVSFWSLWIFEVQISAPQAIALHKSFETKLVTSLKEFVRRNPRRPVVPRYFEIESDLPKPANGKDRTKSSFRLATVVTNATDWFIPRRICKDECCAETVAISIDHEKRRIINTMDGADLADLRIHNFKGDIRVRHHANHFNERMLPCLQPGTIFLLENHYKVIQYFWKSLRPKIEVPFVLITSKSDSSSPASPYSSNLSDPLLLKWYGTNPVFPSNVPKSTYVQKFQPMHLGLSYKFAQELYLRAYLESTNYTNPFLNTDRFMIAKDNHFDWKKNMLTQFGLRRPHRKRLWRALCNHDMQRMNQQDGTSALSCIKTRELTPGQWYAAASHYLFGLSPPGNGWDCYRTYELLLLGIIPIIEARFPVSRQLFVDLPVIQVPKLDARTNDSTNVLLATIKKASEEFLSSKSFQAARFTGWERLFLGYWRRSVLRDAGRETEIIRNDDGNMYWQAWHYTPVDDDPIYCSMEGACK